MHIKDLQDLQWANNIHKNYRETLFEGTSIFNLPKKNLQISENEFYKLLTTRRSICFFS